MHEFLYIQLFSQLLVSNGDPGVPIRFFDVKVGFKETPQESSLILDMQIDTYPGLFITNNKNQEDKCLGIVDVSFVNGDDTDSFLVKLSLVFFLIQDDQISIALGGYPT